MLSRFMILGQRFPHTSPTPPLSTLLHSPMVASYSTVPTPMITGHEYSGVVEAIGEGVRGFKVGDRVTGEGHVTCGHCRNCRGGRQHLCINTYGIGVNRPGAFADLFTLPAGNAFKLPDGITDDIASVMDPLGNAVSGEKSLGGGA